MNKTLQLFQSEVIAEWLPPMELKFHCYTCFEPLRCELNRHQEKLGACTYCGHFVRLSQALRTPAQWTPNETLQALVDEAYGEMLANDAEYRDPGPFGHLDPDLAFKNNEDMHKAIKWMNYCFKKTLQYKLNGRQPESVVQAWLSGKPRFAPMAKALRASAPRRAAIRELCTRGLSPLQIYEFQLKQLPDMRWGWWRARHTKENMLMFLQDRKAAYAKL